MAVKCNFKNQLKLVFEFCAIFFSTLITTALTTCTDPEHQSINNRCLYVENAKQTWHGAMDACRTKSGRLAIIEDNAYVNQIRAMFEKKVVGYFIWVSLRDKCVNGTYPKNALFWMCNETEEATSLNSSMYYRIREFPNFYLGGGGCYALQPSKATLRRLSCTFKTSYLCEMPTSTSQPNSKTCLNRVGNDSSTFEDNCPIYFANQTTAETKGTATTANQATSTTTNLSSSATSKNASGEPTISTISAPIAADNVTAESANSVTFNESVHNLIQNKYTVIDAAETETTETKPKTNILSAKPAFTVISGNTQSMFSAKIGSPHTTTTVLASATSQFALKQSTTVTSLVSVADATVEPTNPKEEEDNWSLKDLMPTKDITILALTTVAEQTKPKTNVETAKTASTEIVAKTAITLVTTSATEITSVIPTVLTSPTSKRSSAKATLASSTVSSAIADSTTDTSIVNLTKRGTEAATITVAATLQNTLATVTTAAGGGTHTKANASTSAASGNTPSQETTKTDSASTADTHAYDTILASTNLQATTKTVTDMLATTDAKTANTKASASETADVIITNFESAITMEATSLKIKTTNASTKSVSTATSAGTSDLAATTTTSALASISIAMVATTTKYEASSSIITTNVFASTTSQWPKLQLPETNSASVAAVAADASDASEVVTLLVSDPIESTKAPASNPAAPETKSRTKLETEKTTLAVTSGHATTMLVTAQTNGTISTTTNTVEKATTIAVDQATANTIPASNVTADKTTKNTSTNQEVSKDTATTALDIIPENTITTILTTAKDKSQSMATNGITVATSETELDQTTMETTAASTATLHDATITNTKLRKRSKTTKSKFAMTGTAFSKTVNTAGYGTRVVTDVAAIPTSASNKANVETNPATTRTAGSEAVTSFMIDKIQNKDIASLSADTAAAEAKTTAATQEMHIRAANTALSKKTTIMDATTAENGATSTIALVFTSETPENALSKSTARTSSVSVTEEDVAVTYASTGQGESTEMASNDATVFQDKTSPIVTNVTTTESRLVSTTTNIVELASGRPTDQVTTRNNSISIIAIDDATTYQADSTNPVATTQDISAENKGSTTSALTSATSQTVLDQLTPKPNSLLVATAYYATTGMVINLGGTQAVETAFAAASDSAFTIIAFTAETVVPDITTQAYAIPATKAAAEEAIIDTNSALVNTVDNASSGANVVTTENVHDAVSENATIAVAATNLFNDTKTCDNQTGIVTSVSRSSIFPMTKDEQVAAAVIQSFGEIIVICLISFVLVTFLLIRNFNFERVLHMTQEIALGLAQTMIWVSKDSMHDSERCKITAAILQFLYTSFFSICCMEAFQTYCIVTGVLLSGGFAKRMHIIFGCIGYSALVTGLTSAFYNDAYPAPYSCWINYGSKIYNAILCPIIAMVCLSIIFLDACSINNLKELAITDRRQLISAKINRFGLFFVLSATFIAMIIGTVCLYYQRFYLYVIVFASNVTLGVTLYIFHTIGNSEYRRAIGAAIKLAKTIANHGRFWRNSKVIENANGNQLIEPLTAYIDFKAPHRS